MGVGVGADLDAGRRHRPKLLQRVRSEAMAQRQVVRERLVVQHVSQRDEVGAGNPLLDQPGNGLLAVVGVAVVEGDADARLRVVAAANPLLGLVERNEVEIARCSQRICRANIAFEMVHGLARSSAIR